jgi:polygalacturonase
MHSRREFVKSLGASAGALTVGPALLGSLGACAHRAATATAVVPASPWDGLPAILARIVPPRFPDRDFDVTTYGAVGNGTSDCTAAFAQAIGACSASGGGRVVVPAGRFLTGAITLGSNVNLHVTADATILFSTDPKAYLPAVFTRFEGTELMGYSPFIYAFERRNVAITGTGTLDGQAGVENWWTWKGSKEHGWTIGMPNYNAARQKLLAQAEAGVPVAERVYHEGSYIRPMMIQTYRCTNVLIEGVTIKRSPMWEIHPVLCSNVTVRGVRIDSHGPNNDGCDPESCTDVLIEGCWFKTGDDCIAIKSGRNADGRRLHAPSQYIVVRGCHMQDGHGGVTVGSEISGDCRWVYAENNVMDSPRLDRALRLKNNFARGGTLEHIYMRNCTVGEVGESVLSIDFTYEEGDRGSFRPVVNDVQMLNVTSRKSEYGVYLRGYPTARISGVALVDCTFDSVAKGNLLENVDSVRFENVKVNGRIVTA